MNNEIKLQINFLSKLIQKNEIKNNLNLLSTYKNEYCRLFIEYNSKLSLN